MRERQPERVRNTHPPQFAVLGAQQARLTTIPCPHDEDVIARVAVLGRPGLREDRDLLDGSRPYTDFFEQLAREGTIVGALGQEDVVTTDQKRAGADSQRV